MKRRLLASILFDCGTKPTAAECAIIHWYHNLEEDTVDVHLSQGWLSLKSSVSGRVTPKSIKRRGKLKNEADFIASSHYYLKSILPTYEGGEITHSDDVYISEYAKELLNLEV